MYLINEDNGRFFGWTEELEKKSGMRKATDEEVDAFLGDKSPNPEDFQSNPVQTFDEAVEKFEKKLELKKSIDEPLHVVDEAAEQPKVENGPNSTDSGSKKPARRRNSRRGR